MTGFPLADQFPFAMLETKGKPGACSMYVDSIYYPVCYGHGGSRRVHGLCLTQENSPLFMPSAIALPLRSP